MESQRHLRIVFVSCLFPPEPEPAGRMAWELARSLHSDGHEVTMVVPFPNRPNGRVYPDYRRTWRRAEMLDGVRVVRCPTWLIGPGRLLRNRFLENFTFGVTGALTEALEPRPDVALVETWPLVACEMSAAAARWRGVPFLYYIQDLYPEVLENSGLIRKGGRLAAALRAWDRHLCLSSRKAIAISESMRDILVESRRLPSGKVAVIPNWVDEAEFRVAPGDNAWRREMGFQQHAFVALFAGTLGIVSGADMLVETAARLRGDAGIVLVCVGQGVLKERMIAEAAARGLTNIRFEPFQDRSRVPAMHAAADVCLLTMRKDFTNASVPSKLVTYLAAGRPVICAAPAETDVAGMVRDAGAGLVVPPGDPDALAAAIVSLRERPGDASAMGANSRRYFEERLAYRHRYRQFLELLFDAAGAGARR